MDAQQLLDFYNQYLTYQDDGTFIWKAKSHPRANKVKIGALAGNKSEGYQIINFTIDGEHKKIGAHRLAFLIHHGWLPIEVDHRDTDRSNNRISNLRVATSLQNCQNSNKKRSNKSGYKGVSWDEARGKWFSKITVNYKQIALGRYKTAIEAAKAYDEAARKYFGEFARTNF